MTDEKLEFANDLKSRIAKLDNEIYEIMGAEPPVRSSNRFFNKKARGNTRKIVNGCLKPREGLNIEIELSNEDCRALIDIRTAEREALQQVLDNLN
ncbi:hypothetical protein [Hungatella effluvii]|uniref:hypothetical protein n=1 Tax=Hungatella effluvii TaxID=1096246 RepID=UPI002A7F6C38|nr:hypothetical protein [Hungatella effluvii]